MIHSVPKVDTIHYFWAMEELVALANANQLCLLGYKNRKTTP